MTPATSTAELLLSVALLYVVPVALLALLLVSPRRRSRGVLSILLLALPLFYIGHYLLLESLQGWPADAPLPERFQLQGFHIEEPNPRNGERGRILLWVTADGDTTPRVHRLDYRKSLHRALVSAGERQAEGRQQVGERAPPRTRAAEPGATEPPSISFRDAPRNTLPAKEAPP